MTDVERITFRKPKLIYDILERLGLRTVGNKAGRPSFPPESGTVRSFYWGTQQVFGQFRNGNESRDAALSRTLEILNENGPSIWGADRSNLVTAQDFEDYPKDLRWNEPADQDLYVK